MKKSIIALSLSSLLLLSACEDKALTEKLSQSEQTVVQLKTELDKLKTEQAFPALQPKQLTLFDKKEMIKFAANVNGEHQDAQSELSANLQILETGIEWLDQLLMQETLKSINQNAFDGKSVTKEMLIQQMEQYYQGLRNEITTEQLFNGQSFDLGTTLIGQRENIVTFLQTRDTYSGGVHGMNEDFYLNFDVAKKAIISLDMLSPRTLQIELTNTLWKNYTEHLAEGERPFTAKEDFYISPQFYFSPEGVNFVYPPYVLGPYAEGSITLTLSWYDAQKLISPDYLWFKYNIVE